jgi:hypothetical protein
VAPSEVAPGEVAQNARSCQDLCATCTSRDPVGFTQVVSAVFQKVDEVAGLGRLDVFTAADCVPIAAAVHELHDRWIVRSSGAFFTLGVNAYMDLASSADSHATYDNPAKIYNEILLDRFGGVLDTIAAALSDATARRVRLADDLARTPRVDGVRDTARRGRSVHFDLQYLRLRERPRYARSTGTLSPTAASSTCRRCRTRSTAISRCTSPGWPRTDSWCRRACSRTESSGCASSSPVAAPSSSR